MVVGERTAGNVEAVLPFCLRDGSQAWIATGVLAPLLGATWEGRGVEPDVVVPPAEALDTALRLVGEDRWASRPRGWAPTWPGSRCPWRRSRRTTTPTPTWWLTAGSPSSWTLALPWPLPPRRWPPPWPHRAPAPSRASPSPTATPTTGKACRGPWSASTGRASTCTPRRPNG